MIDANPYAPPVADEGGAELESGQLVRASRDQRLSAAVLDGLCCLPLIILARYLTTVLGVMPQQRMSYTLILWASMLPLGVYQWTLITRTGQSLGKRWTHLKIVKRNGAPVDFVSGVALRSWPFYLLGLLTWLGVPRLDSLVSLVSAADFLWIFGAAHLCLHDYIAGTRVLALNGGQS